MKPVVLRVIVGGIVISDDKALIIQRSNDDEAFPGLWEIPSGKKESLEDVEKAVVREVEEETGIKSIPVKVLNVFNFKVEKEDEIRDATQINFIVKPLGDLTVKLSGEHQNFAWVNKSELGDYSLSNETRKTLEMALNK